MNSIQLISQTLINGIAAGSAYALIALGFGLAYQTGRFFNIAHGAVYTIGAYGALVCFRAGMPVATACIGGVLIAAVLGTCIELCLYAPLRRKNVSAAALLVASFGVFVVLQNLVAMVFGSGSQTLRPGMLHTVYRLWGLALTSVQVAILICSVVLYLCAYVFLRYSQAGIDIRALGNDRELAGIIGLPSGRILAWVAAIASALAGAAAVLTSLDTDMTPFAGLSALLTAVVAVILGGVGRLQGAVFAALGLGIAQHFTTLYIGSQWADGVSFTLLILFLIARPRGILGTTK